MKEESSRRKSKERGRNIEKDKGKDKKKDKGNGNTDTRINKNKGKNKEYNKKRIKEEKNYPRLPTLLINHHLKLLKKGLQYLAA